jgi:ABC-type Mn2+/Zn2+ transport system ATPase subunit
MFIARALAQEAHLMLMDEPLTGLDVPAQERILEILYDLQEQGVTVMVATHDLNQAAGYFDRVMLLNHQLLGFGPSTVVFTTQNLERAYGGHLHLVESGDGMILLNDTCCGGGHGD